MATQPGKYEPLAVDVEMSQYGYWLVSVSVSPWQRMTVMICAVGISPDTARAMALVSAPPALGGK